MAISFMAELRALEEGAVIYADIPENSTGGD